MDSGRERTPEAEAEAIINSSDESIDDLLEGTEINEGADEDEEPSDLVDMFDRESDDGGDHIDW